MTTLCPTCNNTLDRKHSPELEEDVLRCRVCRRFSLEGLGQWLTEPDVTHLRVMAKMRDENARRQKEMMTSDISDPRWTQIFI